MTGWVGSLPSCVVPALVALVLVAESGLLIGLVLPGASLVIALRVLAGAGVVPLPVAAMTVTAATVVGGALGHCRASRAGSRAPLPTGGRLGRLLPQRVRSLVDRSASPWADASARRPVRTAAVSQLVTGSRTLAPRIAARTGVPLTTMLRGTVPAALLWAWGLVAAGHCGGRRRAAPERHGGRGRCAGRRRGHLAAAPPAHTRGPRSGDPAAPPPSTAPPPRVAAHPRRVDGRCRSGGRRRPGLLRRRRRPGAPGRATSVRRRDAEHRGPSTCDRALRTGRRRPVTGRVPRPRGSPGRADPVVVTTSGPSIRSGRRSAGDAWSWRGGRRG